MLEQADTEICALYQRVAPWFDQVRNRNLMEREYLDAVIGRVGAGASVLDLGCGSGEPIARYLIDAGLQVTGVDGAPPMIAFCRDRFPGQRWHVGDMRGLDLGVEYDAVIAWDSFFHLSRNDQRAMFAVFGRHVRGGGLLLFTSGPADGEVYGEMQGKKLYHASLGPDEYRRLLGNFGFEVVLHRVEDPNCGGHTVWLAAKRTGHDPRI